METHFRDLENTSFSSIDEVVPYELITQANKNVDTPLRSFYNAYAGIHGYVSVFVCTFGIFSNLANIVVLTRKNMVSSTNVILTWLAVADTFKMADYLSFVTLFYILKDPSLEYFQTRSYGRIYFLLFHASFSIVCHTIAIWLTISLAIFRFLYIWFPTRGAAWCSLYRAKVVVFVVYISIALLCIPNYLVNKYRTTTQNTSMNGTDIIYTPDNSHHSFGVQMDEANYYIHSILFKLVPCVMLTILTLLLVYAMHKAYRKRQALKSAGRKEDAERHHDHNRTTGMLLAVVVMFLITELPQGILTLLINLKPNLENELYDPLGDVLDIVALCNNAINFVLYCSMSKQFRDTFVRIFCQCCPRDDNGWSKVKLITSSKNGHKNYMSNEAKATFV